MKNKRFKIIYVFAFFIVIMSLASFIDLRDIPTTVYIKQGENVNINSILKLKAVDNSIKEKVRLFGVIPVKTVNLEVVPKIKLYPGGQPVGIKINTKGVLVVGLTDITGKDGKTESPASKAGIEIGDSITNINGKPIKNSENLIEIVNENKDINVTISRDGKNIIKKVKPIKSAADGSYKLGIWVRDSTAGVGTLTFYDGKTGRFAALGHPITDVDTGSILKVDNGDILNATIMSIKKGQKGDPGELRGIFLNEENSIGSIEKNTMCGIYGSGFKKNNNIAAKPMEIALRNEIKTGDAKILTTINGEKPKYYNIKIDKLLQQDSPGPKSMVIKVTDPELLNKTGGIVQGMSGSPIIQNDKIVGAVTHVLINNPDTGYGIYVEWMLKDAGFVK
ncbi:MAG: SpoIVB peptidase [Clostridium sp.]|nr:SpoIVB peptidase [Clostridium sp.]